MKYTFIILLVSFFYIEAQSQNCKIKKVEISQDSLELLIGYSSYLYDTKNDIADKLLTAYNDYADHVDTCYLFLISGLREISAADGHHLSYFVNQLSIDKQKNIRWTEIAGFSLKKNKYFVTLVSYEKTNNSIKKIYEMKYKVFCNKKGNEPSYLFKK